MAVAWKDSYSFGDDEVDDLRRKLFSATSRFAARPDVASARSAIFEFKTYASTVFALEERIMRETGYRARAVHSGHHDVLSRHTDDLLLSRFKTDAEFVKRAASVIEMWVFNHFMKEDPKVRPALGGKRP